MIPTPQQARLSRLVLITAVTIGLAGMCLGMAMGIAEDFRFKSVHVHVNLIGFVSLFLAGLFYRMVPAAAGAMGWTHYGLTVVGLALMAAGLVGIFMPLAAIAWMVKPGSMLILAGMILFVWIVASATSPSASPGGRGQPAIPFSVVDDFPAQAPSQLARQRAERIIAEAAQSLNRSRAA